MIKVEKIQIPALPTREPRRLYVCLPEGYRRTEKRYPVVYMFDGHNVFYDSHATYGKSWGMREYLKRTKLPVIIVAVECDPEGDSRISEYTPWDISVGSFFAPARGRETMEWFVNDLKPRIDSEYRTLPGREHTMIAGSSMGGLMALWAAVEYNSVFSRAAALSPTLFLNAGNLRDLLQKARLASPTRVYLDYGGDEPNERPDAKRLIFRTADRLIKAGAECAALIAPGDRHSEAYWEKRIPVFMDYLAKDMLPAEGKEERK